MDCRACGALLVSKVHKIAERVDQKDRVRDKDALDILRLLRAIDTDALASRLALLRESSLAGAVTNEAIALLPRFFGDPSAEGVAMAVRAAGDQEEPATIAASLVALVDALTNDPAFRDEVSTWAHLTPCPRPCGTGVSLGRFVGRALQTQKGLCAER